MISKIRSGISLSEYIKDIIDETVKTALYKNAVKEKSLQRALTEEDDTDEETSEEEPEKGGDEVQKKKTEKEPADNASSQKITSPEDKEALSAGDVEADDIIEKLNTIRSGKSFRDDTIKKNMTEYVEGLDKAERTALLAFLLAISQIVTAEMPAAQVLEPDETPSSVKMKKGAGDKQTKHVKPNVIKASPPKKESKPSGEDTSGPVPITPKK